MNIYSLELDNDIKGISARKQYIETLLAKTIAPDVIVLPELALCSYMGSTDIWQYADNDSADTSKWAMAMAENYHTYIAVGYLILSAAKKKPFLADTKFLKYKGFAICDEADNGIQLWCLPFDENALLPKLKNAQNTPTPITTYALFLDGNYITNEQMNDKRFLKLLEK